MKPSSAFLLGYARSGATGRQYEEYLGSPCARCVLIRRLPSQLIRSASGSSETSKQVDSWQEFSLGLAQALDQLPALWMRQRKLQSSFHSSSFLLDISFKHIHAHIRSHTKSWESQGYSTLLSLDWTLWYKFYIGYSKSQQGCWGGDALWYMLYNCTKKKCITWPIQLRVSISWQWT